MLNGPAPDVVVVGGGVIGCATAYFLADAGARVVVVEQHRIGGAPSASGASAAILEALGGHPEPVAQQGQLSRRLIRELAPALRDATGIDVEHQRLGSIHLAFSDREAAGLRGHVPALFEAIGEPTEWLDAAAVREAEPATPARVLGGLRIPSTEGVYAPRYVRALAAGATRRGAVVLEGIAVRGFERDGDRIVGVETSAGLIPAGQVLIASGAWSGLVARALGLDVPVGPQRGQIMALAPQPGAPRVAHVVHGPGGYVIPKGNGTACVGATHEDVGFDARVTTYGMKFLADLAYRLVPGLETATVKHVWMGFRPVMLRDTLPPVGPLPGLRNAFVAAGHGAIGVTLSAGVGRTLAQLMRGDRPDLPLDAFDPARSVTR